MSVLQLAVSQSMKNILRSDGYDKCTVHADALTGRRRDRERERRRRGEGLKQEQGEEESDLPRVGDARTAPAAEERIQRARRHDAARGRSAGRARHKRLLTLAAVRCGRAVVGNVSGRGGGAEIHLCERRARRRHSPLFSNVKS